MTTISFQNVWKEYDGKVVLEKLSLEIAPHAFVALVGPSGCGKTHLPAHVAQRGDADARAHPRRWRAAAAPSRRSSAAWCFSAIRCFRI